MDYMLVVLHASKITWTANAANEKKEETLDFFILQTNKKVQENLVFSMWKKVASFAWAGCSRQTCISSKCIFKENLFGISKLPTWMVKFFMNQRLASVWTLLSRTIIFSQFFFAVLRCILLAFLLFIEAGFSCGVSAVVVGMINASVSALDAQYKAGCVREHISEHLFMNEHVRERTWQHWFNHTRSVWNMTIFTAYSTALLCSSC